MIEQLVIAKPEDPIVFLMNLLKKENDDGEFCWMDGCYLTIFLKSNLQKRVKKGKKGGGVNCGKKCRLICGWMTLMIRFFNI